MYDPADHPLIARTIRPTMTSRPVRLDHRRQRDAVQTLRVRNPEKGDDALGHLVIEG
jgi:hypothetical protein